MKKVLVLHGPNINLTGIREPDTYGRVTFEDINREIMQYAQKLGLECEIFQSNHEGALIDKIHEALDRFDGIVINAGAYTTATRSATPSPQCTSPASRCTCPTSMPASRSATNR